MKPMIFAALAALAVPSLAQAQNNGALFERMGAADTNRDGFVTRTELVAFRSANFARLDRDGNGALGRSDIPRMASRLYPDLDFDTLLRQFDADRNGQVSRTEFVNGPTTLFDAADSNRDDRLSEAERRAAATRRGD